jgi:hypothetical protein
MFKPRGFTFGFENGFPNDFPETNSSIPEFKAFNCATAFVEPDKSKIYVVISGAGKVGNVSSARIDLTAELKEPHPVNVKERTKAITMVDRSRFFRLSHMGISMLAGTDKGNPHPSIDWVIFKPVQMNLISLQKKSSDYLIRL